MTPGSFYHRSWRIAATYLSLVRDLTTTAFAPELVGPPDVPFWPGGFHADAQSPLRYRSRQPWRGSSDNLPGRPAEHPWIGSDPGRPPGTGSAGAGQTDPRADPRR